MEVYSSILTPDKPVIVNIAGYGGSCRGYEDKYVKIAEFLKERNFASFISVSNDFDALDIFHRHTYKSRMLSKLLLLFEKFSKDDTVYVMGTSAGASIIPILTEIYPSLIKKILLTATSENVAISESVLSIRKFKGEVSILVGLEDNVVGIEPSIALYKNLHNAIASRIQFVPGCDHNFSGELNGRIFSSSVLWAFNNEALSPDNGIKLYDNIV